MDQEEKSDAAQPVPLPPLPAKEPARVDAVPAEPATAKQLEEVEKKMSGFERATLRWARAAVILSALAAAFVCAQWWEMHEGGKDTRNLAVAAGNQATWTQRLADSAKTQSDRTQILADRTKDLADRMKDQANQTRTIANQAIVQADAAKSAADTAVAGLRPWIKITNVQTRGEGPEIPALSFQTEPTWPAGTSQATFQLQISLKNIGHSPARLTVDFELFLPIWKNGYSDVIYKEKRRFCSVAAKKGLKVDPSLKIILFPEESHDWNGGGAALIDSKVINHFSDSGPNPYVLPVVAVCTNYQFGDSPTVYQTSALYEVFRKDDRTRFFEVGKGVPAREIFMLRNEASDDAY